MVYGGFWIGICLLFVVLFLGCNFSNARRVGKLKEQFKNAQMSSYIIFKNGKYSIINYVSGNKVP